MGRRWMLLEHSPWPIFSCSRAHEGLPNAVLEAQAAGGACLRMGCQWSSRRCDPGRSGNLYHLGDYAAMADGIVELLRAPERYTAMSLNSSAFVAQHFDAPIGPEPDL